jgi:hypothetical protein
MATSNFEVKVTCPHCKYAKTIMVVGEWDIERVTHECPYRQGKPSSGGPPDFKVTFDPPRRVF